jgi:hypothetical protein
MPKSFPTENKRQDDRADPASAPIRTKLITKYNNQIRTAVRQLKVFPKKRKSGCFSKNYGAVREGCYFSDSLCIFSRFVETRFQKSFRKCRTKEDVSASKADHTSFSNFSDTAGNPKGFRGNTPKTPGVPP